MSLDFLTMTPEERAERNRRHTVLDRGRSVLKRWLEGAAQYAVPVDFEAEFRALGPFRAQYEGAIDRDYRPLRSEVTFIESAPDLKPPDRLYRAATEEGSTGWNWFDSFAKAKAAADMYGSPAEIWSCTPEEVFGCVEIVREEPAASPYDKPYEARWNLWILKPGRVWKMPRWRDPFAPIPKQSTWEGRGVTEEEARSIVHSWVTENPFKVSPFDRETKEFWVAHFDLIGQFSAVHKAYKRPINGVGGKFTVKPETDLAVPEVLYRGADESRATRWSWTTELEAAQLYARSFGQENKVWCCTPQRVFGRVDFVLPKAAGGNIWQSHTEWLLIPDEVWLASRPQDDPRKRGELPADFWN